MANPLVVAVANHKGGVAKTASTLAEAAVSRGLTVGLIDLDPNCTFAETLESVDLDASGIEGPAARRPRSEPGRLPDWHRRAVGRCDGVRVPCCPIVSTT